MNKLKTNYNPHKSIEACLAGLMIKVGQVVRNIILKPHKKNWDIKQSFKSIREVLEDSLEHEIKVTKNTEAISELAKREGDNTTYEFAQGFLKEQVEEEKFRNLLFKLDLNMPDWKTDELFESLL